MNGLPKDGKMIGADNSFSIECSGRLRRILNEENPIIPLSAKDKVRLACFEGREDKLKESLMNRIGEKGLLTAQIQKNANEFFEKAFGIGKSTEIKPDSQDNYRRRLAILENLYGKDVYNNMKISDSMEKYQLDNIYTLALENIAAGRIK